MQNQFAWNNTTTNAVAFDNLKYRVIIDTAPVCSFIMNGFSNDGWMDHLSVTICPMDGSLLMESGVGLMHNIANIFDQFSLDALRPFENLAGGPELQQVADAFAVLALSYRDMGKDGKFVTRPKIHTLSFDMEDGSVEHIIVKVEPVIRYGHIIVEEQETDDKVAEQLTTVSGVLDNMLNEATNVQEEILVSSATLHRKHMAPGSASAALSTGPSGNMLHEMEARVKQLRKESFCTTEQEEAMNELDMQTQELMMSEPEPAPTKIVAQEYGEDDLAV